MPAKTYHSKKSKCAIANALDIIGDRWTMLIIRDMLFGNAHEYQEFLASDEGISTNILADRLKELQENGIIQFIHHPENKKRKLYYLTDMGKDLIYPILELSKWSHRHLGDKVKIPEEFLQMIKNEPDGLIKMIFATVQEWETEFLNDTKS